MKRKIIQIFAIALLISFSVAPIFSRTSDFSMLSDNALIERGFEEITDNGQLKLFFNSEMGNIAVKKLSTGYVWYTTPLDWELDESGSGFNKNAMASLLSIRNKDQNGIQYPANSYTNVIKRNTLTVEDIPNGIRLVHLFKREGVEVPLDISIEDDTLLMSVPLGLIWENPEDTLRILNFTIAPYFGAALRGEEGYMVVPDGMGALIKFDNDKSSESYQQYVYGRNPSVVPVMKRTVSETSFLPIFGLSGENAGFLAVVEQCAARGYINAETSLQKTGYNAISASCVVRDTDMYNFKDRTGMSRTLAMFEGDNFKKETFSVRYLLLDENEKDYVSMAKRYREYLQEKDMFPKEKLETENSFVVNFIGSGQKVKPIMGIPMQVNVPYTSYEQAQEVIEKLLDNGIKNIVVKYDGWIAGGLKGEYPSKAKAEKNLGGKKDLLKLISYLDEKNIPLYLGADFVNLYKTDLSHIKEITTNRGINKSPVAIPEYYLSTYNVNTTADKSYMLRASNIEKYFDKFMDSFDTYLSESDNVGLSLDTLGNTVASDFVVKKGTTRQATLSVFDKLLTKTQSKLRILLSRPFDYAFNSVSYITDAPTTTSRYDIENEMIPFYQLVIKGYIPFSNLPGNRDLSKEQYVLRLLETGSNLSYLWITENPEDLRDTKLDAYTNVYFEDWIDESIELYKELSGIQEKIAGCAIVSHSINSNGLRETWYENGVGIFTNYSDKQVSQTDSKTLAKPVAAYSYRIAEESERSTK